MNFVGILIAIVIFGLIVMIHEFGHLLIAKANGIKVSEFSIGMGPRLFSFGKGETKYSLKLLPLGGSCMMGEDEESDDERAFTNKGVWARIATIFAGPFFNFVLAFIISMVIISIAGYDPAYVVTVDENSAASKAGLRQWDIISEIDGSNVHIARDLQLYFYLNELEIDKPVEISYLRDGEEYTTVLVPEAFEKYYLGITYKQEDTAAKVESITPDYPFDKAGVKAGDIITEVNGTPISSGKELGAYIAEHPFSTEPVTVQYERNGVKTDTVVTPMYTRTASTGFSYNYQYVQYREEASFGQVIKYGFIEVGYWIKSTIKGLGRLITGRASSDEIGGPVRIVSELGNVVEESSDDGILYVFLNLMNWTVLLSANLGVMNLLPIPALDGGRLMFLIIEVFRGKPIEKEKEAKVHLIGFIILMVLMVFIFSNDIFNLVKGCVG